jgi:glycosyltransferase involved in cell wall biosynthesis
LVKEVPSMSELKTAVLIPCFNEERTVVSVIKGFQEVLPDATVFVLDNNSTDRTAELSGSAGATVISVLQPGKGNVMRRAFADIEADVYVMIDGDGTYDVGIAPEMVQVVADGSTDLVNCVRVLPSGTHSRRGHSFGNRVLTGSVRRVFGVSSTDMLSGFKAMSKRFVKSMPVFSKGFEIETEIAVHAFNLNSPMSEIEGEYIDRPEGSFSKLSTFKDGWRILRTIVSLARHGRPLFFYGIISLLLMLAAVILGIPLFVTFAHTHKVPRLPTAVLITGLVLLSALSVVAGLILDSVTKNRRELRMLAYLSTPGTVRRCGS